MTPRIAVLGMGTMGAPMARNLSAAGWDVTVYNRTRDKCRDLVAAGATIAETPADAARDVPIVLCCVSDTADVRSILLDDRTGVATTVKRGSTVVDCSTISPVATREFAGHFRASGVGYVDAPVSGGSEGAERGTLAIMCGGTESDFEAVRPALEVIGGSVNLVGPVGAGQVTKAVNQVLISGTYQALAEGLALATKSGVDPEKVVAAIRGGAAASWVLDNRSGNMIDDEYPLGFRLALHRKDLGIALQTGKAEGVSMPLSELVAAAEDALLDAGRADEDMSVLAARVREKSDIPPGPMARP